MQQSGRHRGVYTAAHSTHAIFVAKLTNYGVGLKPGKVCHVPGACATADVHNKVLDDLRATRRMCHFWMELHTPHPSCRIFNSRILTTWCTCYRLEAAGQLGDLVTMAHPYLHSIITCDVFE